MVRGILKVTLAAALLSLFSPAIAEIKVPAGFTASVMASGLNHPTALAAASDGRVFVCEKTGALRVIKGGKLLPDAFATVPALLRGEDGEAGLIGVALHPGFPDTPYVYVFYTTATPNAHTRISRFKAAGDAKDAAEGEVVLLDIASSAWNHNGGALHFGPDGKLYAAVGESGNPPNAQSLTNLLGKILRMNPVPDSAAQVPSDNPLLNQTTGRNRLIWAYGLRNPYTFAFQPGTGRMFINDVGQSTFEEINEGKAGANYGWSPTEGPFDPVGHPGMTPPLLAYKRSAVGNSTGAVGECIVGAAFYPASATAFPAEYRGKYFFGDHPYDSWIRVLDPANPSVTLPFATGTDLGDLTIAPDGTLWFTDHDAGAVVRIAYGSSAVPGETSGLPFRRNGPRLVFDSALRMRIERPASASGAGFSDLNGRRIPGLSAPSEIIP